MSERITYEEVPGSRTTQEAVYQPQRERIAYEDLQPGEIIQEGDQWQNECFRWRPFLALEGSRVQVRQGQRVRRPYNITQLQGDRDEARAAVTQMMVQLFNQAEVLAEVRADEKRLFDDLELLRREYATVQQERDLARAEVARLSTELWARKPLEDRVASLTEELAQARAELQRLQDERDELKAALQESHAAHEFTMKQGLATIAERNEAERLLAESRMERDKAWNDQNAIQAYRDTALQKLGNAEQALIEERAAHVQTRSERDEACRERDLARAEVARLSTELWARKPLEERIASLTHELANAAVDGYNLQHERDETRAELQRLQEVVGNLYNEPTARQVQDMLRTWATELDWSAGCFDSAGRDEIDTIQRTLIAVVERIETMVNPEGGSDGE